MALFAKKQVSLFFLLTLLSTFHARDRQFFNKIPSTTTTTPTTTTTTTLPNTEQFRNNEQVQNQQEQEPDFNPENENSYGLYSHETGQLPPSTTTTQVPLNKHLPKNYNPVAYVTVPEDNNNNSEFTDEKSFSTNPTNFKNNDNSEFIDEKSFATNPTNFNNNDVNQNYYNNFQEQQEEEPESRNYKNNNDNYNYEKFNYMSGGSSFNSQPQAQRNGFQPQGMSDTRFMENGKYFYDVNNEKYSNNHPYESLKGVQPTNEFSNNRNFYGNNRNGNEFSSNNGNRGNGNEFDNVNYVGDNGYQSQAEFQNEENYNMP